MSYSLLEMQETLRNIPMDGVQRVARGEHGKANQLLGMDEIKRRSEHFEEAQAKQAEQAVMQEPPMVDQYMQMAQAMSGRPPMQGPPGMGPPPGMALPMPQPGGPPMGPQMGSQRPPMPPQAPQMGAPAPPMGLAGLAPGGPPPMSGPGYQRGGIVGYSNGDSVGSWWDRFQRGKQDLWGLAPNMGIQREPTEFEKIDSDIMDRRREIFSLKQDVENARRLGLGPSVSALGKTLSEKEAELNEAIGAHKASKKERERNLTDPYYVIQEHEEGRLKDPVMSAGRGLVSRAQELINEREALEKRMTERGIPVPDSLVKSAPGALDTGWSSYQARKGNFDLLSGVLGGKREDESSVPRTEEESTEMLKVLGMGPEVGELYEKPDPKPDPKGDPESRGEYDWNSPWSALMMAGLNIAAGESPDALTNISQGALGGVQDVMGRRVQERELKATEDLRKAQMDQARASLIRNQLDRPMKFEEYVDLHYPATERDTHDEGQRRRKIAELMTQYELYKSSIGRGYQIFSGGDGIAGAHSLDLESGEIASG